MLESNMKSPGVYVNEINSFPDQVAPVATAVPAFIGYTPQASYQGKSYINVPTKVSSFQQFQSIFCFPSAAPPAAPVKQYTPQYYLVAQQSQPPPTQDYVLVNNIYYAIVPDPHTIYYLYNSVQLFFQNGGGDAYIVSVGGYGPPSNAPAAVDAHVVNPNVKLDDLLGGLQLLMNEDEPTMYICTEATLLSIADNGTLMQAMLMQCSSMMTAISIFDIIGGRNPDPIHYTDDISAFRNNTGTSGLSYGAAYYPFVGTTVMQPGDLNYTNLFGGDLEQLATILCPQGSNDSATANTLANMQGPTATAPTVIQYHNALMVSSERYSRLINQLQAIAGITPPSGAIAGVITTVDNEYGVWEAPANKSIIGAGSLPINLSDAQQAELNVDPVSGKSINAIRSFNGMGILVWGVRTLDGNSQDWRYLNVRRTATFIEQSCKLAAQPYVFQPNVQSTWETVKAQTGNFLNSIWKRGGLQGVSPSDAYSVACGLGTTMTADDINNGFINVLIKVAITHPAEFIVITFQQEMAVSN